MKYYIEYIRLLYIYDMQKTTAARIIFHSMFFSMA